MKYFNYFKNTKYNREENNCWTFVRDIFKNEQGIYLPELPIMTDLESVTFLKSNIKYKVIDKPREGILIFFNIGRITHIGYCINEKEFIHKNKIGAAIEKIPNKAIFYEVLK